MMSHIQKMKEYAEAKDVPIMLEEGISFLLETINKYQIKSILEVGTAIGYSSIMMASISDDITIDTLEIDEERYQQAILNIEHANLSGQIKVHLGDALMFKSDVKYDLIFIDAAKSQYRRYMDFFENNLSDKGIYFFDNLEFHGMVDDPGLAKSRNTRQLVKKIRKFRDEILENDCYDVQFYKEIGDGVAIVSIKNK